MEYQSTVVDVPVTRVRRGQRGTLPVVPQSKLLSSKRDSTSPGGAEQSAIVKHFPILKANAYGIDATGEHVSDLYMLRYSEQLFRAAYGLQRVYPIKVIAVEQQAFIGPLLPVAKLVGCESKPAFMGNSEHLHLDRSMAELNNSVSGAERKAGQPRYGVRPNVLVR